MKKCPNAQYCGGCSYQGIAYDKQLKIKQERIEELLSGFGNVSKIIGCKQPLNYRNKVQFSFGYDEDHKVISGYYLPKSHMIVPVKECMIADEKINQIYASIRKIINRLHISIFDERVMKGCLRHLVIHGTSLGEYMVVLVSGSATLHKKEEFVKEILKYNPEVKTIIHNINNKRTSTILGSRNTVLYGKGYITDELCGLSFRISASSFYQVNRFQTSVLYETAIKAAALTGNETLIDAYCGTGTIGLVAANSAKKVFGVESNASAVKDAKLNMKLNQIENAQFILEDAGKYMDDLAKRKTHIDVLIMDPPRAGSDQRFLKSLIEMAPAKVVYVSCNPVTLKRDLQFLNRYYDVKMIQPVDMFPFTDHIETVCSLYHR
ncbi:MAG: 23S rRNA (uracil(1939)-C(5))-methyltransferase RlmD [Erysipelotrichaceae bacterium]|nr:23S rRNA (uracil(1939)-C(5))-methyltransferase RlmD [Erysipelotrichaceae bacterium]